MPQNDAEAVTWFRKAADQGNADAQNVLGLMYDNGQGVPQDYVEAVTWFRKAADQGVADAQFNLGIVYGSGRGVKQGYAEAVTWYRKAAEQGHVMAQVNLGFMCANGQGVPQDYVQAYMWFNLAAVRLPRGRGGGGREGEGKEREEGGGEREGASETENRAMAAKNRDRAASEDDDRPNRGSSAVSAWVETTMINEYAKPANQEYAAANWEECEQRLLQIEKDNCQSLSGVWFRGVANAEWCLLTTLERRSAHFFSVADYYDVMSRVKPEVETFTRSTWVVPDWSEPGLGDFAEYFRKMPAYGYMAHLRHHEFPSPLLDWSRSPYISAYFAFADEQAKKAKNVAIYVFSETPHNLKFGNSAGPKICQPLEEEI